MNPKVEKILKLPLYKRLLILAGMLLVVVGVFVWLLILPQFDELDRLEQSKLDLERDYQQKLQIANNLDRFKAEYAKMEEQLEQALTQLPNKKEIPTLLTNIAGVAKDNGLEVLSFRPGNESPKGFYAEVPVELKLAGDYHQVALFCDAIGNLPRIVNVSNLSLTNPKPGEGNAALQVSCKVTTFRFLENTGG